MSLFDGIELEKLFDNESEYGKELTFAPVTIICAGKPSA